jgi:hypothetical protein
MAKRAQFMVVLLLRIGNRLVLRIDNSLIEYCASAIIRKGENLLPSLRLYSARDGGR